MALNAKQATGGGTGNRPDPLEPGTYPARLAVVASIGLQKQRPFKGEEKEPREELLTIYELTDEFMKDEEGNELEDKPRWLTDRFPFYHLSSERATSTKRYVALDPDLSYEGDWRKLIETPCMLTVSKDEGKDGKVYNNISNVSTMREKEAAKTPKLVNKPIIFDIDVPDLDAFTALPEWVQNVIKEGLEFEGSKLAKMLDGGSQDHTEHEPEPESDGDEDW